MNARFLKLRGDVYYFRRRIWLELYPIFNKHELWISLRTTNLREALRYAQQYELITDIVFKIFREGVALVDLDELKKRALGLEVESTTTLPDGTSHTRKVNMTTDDIKVLADSGASPTEISDIARSLLNEGKAPSMPFSMPIQHPVSSQVPISPPLPKTNFPKVSELIEEYKRHYFGENSKGVDRGSITKFRRLLEIVGEDATVDLVNNTMADFVREQLKLLPSGSGQYRGMTVPQILSAVKGEKYTRLKAKAANDYLELYTRLFRWIKRKRGCIDLNPFEEVRVKETEVVKAKHVVDMFSDEDLEKIFSSEIFTSYDPTKPNHLPFIYFGVLIAAYSGARPCEITALYLDDIKELNGIGFIDYNDGFGDDGSGLGDKCAKTANSIRRTPIHSHLIELGFLDFVEQRRSEVQGDIVKYAVQLHEATDQPLPDDYQSDYASCKAYIEEIEDQLAADPPSESYEDLKNKKIPPESPFNRAHRLFPELNRERNGYARKLGEYFNGVLLKELGIHVHRKKIFYSFRHTVGTKLHQAKVHVMRIEQISGRDSGSPKTTGELVYIKDDELPVLAEELEKLNYGELVTKVKPFTKC